MLFRSILIAVKNVLKWQPKKSVFDRLVFNQGPVFDRVSSPSTTSRHQFGSSLAKNKDRVQRFQFSNSGTLFQRPVSCPKGMSGPSILICGRCLKFGHPTRLCRGPLRCRACYQIGYLSSTCSNRPTNHGFAPKKCVERLLPERLGSSPG